jgi:GNAT superfamily N-acetyltransferase
VLIRKIKADDLEGLLALYEDLHTQDEPLPERIKLESVWADILSYGHQSIFVVEQGGMLVATCALQVIPNLTRGARPYALIENVVTRKDRRGQGHASGILKYALEYAWAQGCYKVMLMTGRDDPKIFELYEKAGFKRGVKTGFVVTAPKVG